MERLSTGFTCGELGSQEDDEGKDATLGGHLTTTTASPTNHLNLRFVTEDFSCTS